VTAQCDPVYLRSRNTVCHFLSQLTIHDTKTMRKNLKDVLI